jgi:hypothetical protein
MTEAEKADVVVSCVTSIIIYYYMVERHKEPEWEEFLSIAISDMEEALGIIRRPK